MANGIAVIICDSAVNDSLRMQAKHEMFGVETRAYNNCSGESSMLIKILANVKLRFSVELIFASFQPSKSEPAV